RQVGHPDPDVQARAERPARDLAAADDLVALAGDAGPGQLERHEPLVRAGLACRADRISADKARFLLAAPAQSGLDRAARLHEVVAVEVKADLQAQGVARREARRVRSAPDEHLPERRRVGRVAEDLDAVLTGVAGPAHD